MRQTKIPSDEKCTLESGYRALSKNGFVDISLITARIRSFRLPISDVHLKRRFSLSQAPFDALTSLSSQLVPSVSPILVVHDCGRILQVLDGSYYRVFWAVILSCQCPGQGMPCAAGCQLVHIRLPPFLNLFGQVSFGAVCTDPVVFAEVLQIFNRPVSNVLQACFLHFDLRSSLACRFETVAFSKLFLRYRRI